MTESAARGSSRGFTLVEMMVAMGILVVGVTSLIGLLTVGVSVRSTAELRSRAVLLAEQVLHDIEENVLAEDDGEELSDVDWEQIDGFPRMERAVDFVVDPEHPDLVLARVRVRWRDQGAATEQVFSRLLPRETPFRDRVLRLRRSR